MVGPLNIDSGEETPTSRSGSDCLVEYQLAFGMISRAPRIPYANSTPRPTTVNYSFL